MEKKEVEINLSDILFLLLSKLPFILLLAVLGTIGGFAVAKGLLPVKYTSSVSIYVNNYSAATDITAEGKINGADIQTAKALASTYIVILQDDIVYDEVSKRLLKDYDTADLSKIFNVQYENGEPYISAGQIRSLVSINSVNDTEVISISTTSENPHISADICFYISDIAPDLLTRTTKAGSVETIGSAKVPTAPSSPNVKRITILGLLLGGFLGAAIVIIGDMFDTTVNNGEDLKKAFPDIAVLGEIPDLMDTKGGVRYEYK